MAHCLLAYDEVNTMIGTTTPHESRLQTYRSWCGFSIGPSSVHRRCLSPSFGFTVPDGVGIWHAEGRGPPHCIAGRPLSNTHVQIIDGRHVWSISKIDAEKVFHDADDAGTVVTFTWQIREGGLHAALLDLCA